MAAKNWPHPVLDSTTGDYPNCAFQARTEIRQTRLEFKCRTEFDLGCDTLENCISDGQAEYLVQVSCPRTAYRATFTSARAEIEYSIPEHELRDLFLVAPFIVCKTPFALESDELASTFAGLRFVLSTGAVLASAPATEFYAEKTFDELKNVSAIFEVVRHIDAKNSAVEYDFNRNKIAVFLPHGVYADYRLFKSRTPYRELFVCSLVVPGLAAAIESSIGEDDEDSATYRWRRVLRRQLKAKGIESIQKEDCFKTAQALLEYPHGRALEAIRVRESEG